MDKDRYRHCDGYYHRVLVSEDNWVSRLEIITNKNNNNNNLNLAIISMLYLVLKVSAVLIFLIGDISMLPLYSIEDNDTAVIVESQSDPNWVNKTGLADPVPYLPIINHTGLADSVPDLPILNKTGLSGNDLSS